MLRVITLFVILVMNTSQVNAVVLSGGSLGSFNGAGNVLEWGAFGPLVPSSLEYNGNAGFSTSNSNPVEIGLLTYNNTVIPESLSISEANFALQLDLNSADLTGSFVYNYDFSIVETNNASGNPFDTITINPAVGSNPFLATIDGVNFNFELLGFDDGSGGFNNFFTLDEGQSATIALNARITGFAPVPVPPAIWLFITALSGFFMSSKRKHA